MERLKSSLCSLRGLLPGDRDKTPSGAPEVSSPRRDPISQLPEDIVQRIFGPLLVDYGSLILVCKGWKRLFSSPALLWEDVRLHFQLTEDVKSSDRARALCWLEQRGAGVQRLEVTISHQLSSPKNLERIKLKPALQCTEFSTCLLSSILERASPQSLKALFLTAAKPEEVEIPGFGDLTALQALPSLEFLSIRGLLQTVIPGVELKPLDSHSGPRLKELFLSTVSTDHRGIQLLQSLEIAELRKFCWTLVIKNYFMSAPVSLHHISKLEKLEALQLPHAHVQDSNLSRLTELRTLVISFMSLRAWPLDLEAPASLLQLRLTSDKIPSRLAGCTALRHLELHDVRCMFWGYQGDLEALEQLLRNLPLLEQLSISRPLRKLPAALDALPNLRVLNFLSQTYVHEKEDKLHWPWLSQLRVLGLGLVPKIPSILSTATNLEFLHLSIEERTLKRVAKYHKQARVLAKLPRLKKVTVGISNGMFCQNYGTAAKTFNKFRSLLSRVAPQIEVCQMHHSPIGAIGDDLKQLSVEPSECYKLQNHSAIDCSDPIEWVPDLIRQRRE